MTLSQLVAQSTALLANLRDKEGPEADAEPFISLKSHGLPTGTDEERSLEGVELFKSPFKPQVHPQKWFFEIKTEKEENES